MNVSLIIPGIFLFCWAIFVLIVDFTRKSQNKMGIGYLSIFGLLFTIFLVFNTDSGVGFAGTFISDSYSKIFNLIFLVSAILTIIASLDFVELRLRHKGEFYGLMLLATSGMLFLSSASDLITLYVSLELATIPLYVMAAYMKKDLKSTEAGLKYLIIGGASSGILLFGMSILYGLTGTTIFSEMKSWELAATQLKPALTLAIVMLIAGFGFKLAAAPFHMWAPDVYEGAPTPVTAFLSTASKAAGLVAFVRVFFGALSVVKTDWVLVLEIVAVLAMVVGNFVALTQTNIRGCWLIHRLPRSAMFSSRWWRSMATP